jgi:hypothetical protein
MNTPSPSGRRRAAPGRATISDVALKAGVSKATVSSFLNRREELLSPEIDLRVERAISALAYSPSPMARALKRGRSRLIGLVVADVTNPFSVCWPIRVPNSRRWRRRCATPACRLCTPAPTGCGARMAGSIAPRSKPPRPSARRA